MKPILVFVEKNFSTLLIAALVFFLWNKGVFNHSAESGKGHSDTVITYQVGQAPQQTTTPSISISIPPASVPQAYQPDTSYKGLLRQYEALLQKHLATNIYQDTLRLKDSTGREFAQVPVKDFISENQNKKKEWSYSYSLPKVTITNTLPAKPRTQLYLGGEITSPLGQNLGIESAQVGLLLKNKRDQILKATVGYNFQSKGPTGTIGYYPKISFRKK